MEPAFFSWQALRRNWPMFTFGACVVGFVALLGSGFYVRGQQLMEDQLKARLRDAAAVAALQFSADDIAQVHGEQSVDTPAVQKLAKQLRAIRSSMPAVRFAYLMRRTNDPLKLEFVADADSIATDAELDRNKNGAVEEDEEASYPGDLYDATGILSLSGQAFVQPAVDDAITQDQWGALISGYAPIRDAQGTTVAVLGIDMQADEFLRLSQSIFSPVALLLACFTSLFFVAYVMSYLSRRRIETLKRVDEERSSIMLLASHQLGTPLTIFQWSIEAIRDSMAHQELSKEIEQNLHNMQEGVDRLRSVLNDLRHATQVDSAAFDYKKEVTPLADLVAAMAKSMEKEFDRKMLKVKLELDHSLQVPLDPHLIGDVVRELLFNALTYSDPARSISVSVLGHRNEAVITVRDQGCGIPAADLPRIFGKFVRGANAHLWRPDGNGLGLYIAKRIIDRAGGNISISSKEGQGTTVRVSLPLH